MTPKENLLRVIRHDRPAWVPNGMESVWQLGPPVVERPGQAGLDSWGVRFELKADAHGGTFPAHEGHTITDLSTWRQQITIPDVDAMDFSGVAAAAAEIDRQRHLVSGFVEFGLFERSYCLLGMEQALMAYLTEPDLMAELVGAIADYKIRLIRRFDEVADLDILWYGDDWGNQRQLFLPPDVWRRIIKPHTKRIFDAALARGILINLHSCGRIEEVFGDIVEMGPVVWNPCQPCNDLTALKRRFGGRIAYCGGIDSQFVLDRPGVTGEDVRAEVRRRIDDLAGGGGYIAGPSHAVPYDPCLLDAMNDEIATYGRAFYRSPGHA